MRRIDLWLGIAVIAFALFIGREMIGVRSSRSDIAATAVGFQAGATSENAVVVAGGTIPPPARDVSAIRRRIQDHQYGTFIGEILAVRDSSIARWADRRADPVRVWVEEQSPLQEFDSSFPSQVRRAFADWGSAGVPLAFTFVSDSGRAEVKVTFVDHFDAAMSGRTRWERDPNWWIVGGDIELSLRSGSGRLLTPPQFYAIALHEVGHLLGLDHTKDTTAVMSPLVSALSLTPKDVATMRLIYELTPGTVK